MPRLTREEALAVLAEYPDADLSAFDADHHDIEGAASLVAAETLAKINHRERCARRGIPAEDADRLRFAGALGHTFVIMVGGPGTRDAVHETCDKYRALFLARTEYAGRAPTVYQQTKPGIWRPVRA